MTDNQLSERAGANVGTLPTPFLNVGQAQKMRSPFTRIVQPPSSTKDYLVVEGKALRALFLGVTFNNPTNSGGDLPQILLFLRDSAGGEVGIGGGGCNQGSVSTVAASGVLVPIPEGSKLFARVTADANYGSGPNIAVMFGAVVVDLLPIATLEVNVDLKTSLQTVIPKTHGKSMAAAAILGVYNADSITHNVEYYVNDGTSDIFINGGSIGAGLSGVFFPGITGFPIPFEGLEVKAKILEAIATKHCYVMGIPQLRDTPPETDA